MSPIIRLLAILIQNNANGSSTSGERSSDNAKSLSTTHIDDFEPKVLVALYETIYTFIVNILQVIGSGCLLPFCRCVAEFLVPSPLTCESNLYLTICNIQDAQLYADHAHHKEILVSDVKLAIETRAGLDYTLPPSRDVCWMLSFDIHSNLMHDFSSRLLLSRLSLHWLPKRMQFHCH